VLEVDGLGLFGKNLHSAASVVVALLEGCERLCGVATEAEFGAEIGPVDLEGSRRTLFTMSAIAEEDRELAFENIASNCRAARCARRSASRNGAGDTAKMQRVGIFLDVPRPPLLR
jgi:hypothetical protein